MKKLLCLMVAMLLAVNASAAVWVGDDTAVAPTPTGDGTSWDSLDNWLTNDAVTPGGFNPGDGSTQPTFVPAAIARPTALPSSTEATYILGTHDYQWGAGTLPAMNPYPVIGPVMVDSGFTAGSGATIAGSAQTGDLYVGYWRYGHTTLNVSSTGTLDVNGNMILNRLAQDSHLNNQGAVNVTGDLWLGWQSTNDCTASNWGTMNVGGDLVLGVAYTNNVLNMHSGTLDIGGTLDLDQGGFGNVNLYGGTVHAGGLVLDQWYQDTIDITEGTLILEGDWTTGYIDPENAAIGWGLDFWTTPIVHDAGNPGEWTYLAMSAYGGAGTVMYEYDDTTGLTTVWAVPEPATMTLLGLGAVALLRHRK